MTSEEFDKKYNLSEKIFAVIPNAMGHDVGLDGMLAIIREWERINYPAMKRDLWHIENGSLTGQGAGTVSKTDGT